VGTGQAGPHGAAAESDHDITSQRVGTLGRHQFGTGRLGTYTLIGAATGVVPLPWIPDAIVKRLRGALIHDVVSRRGLSLSPDARAALVEPSGTSEGARNYLRQGAMFAATRVLGRLGPLALVGPIRSALGTFVLGHLVERYLDNARTARSIRIDVDEAKRLRRAIDHALIQAITTAGKDAREDKPFPPEDFRDPTTQFVDGVFITVASAPGWLVRRLEAAFDETLAGTHP
jgi:hypothetical protein